MPGAEAALVSFGLACSIFQTIQFASEAISTLKTVYRTGSPDPALVAYNTTLKGTVQRLDDSLNRTPNNNSSLVPLAKKCLDASAALEKELEKISKKGSDQPRALKAIITFIVTGVKKWKIGKLAKELENARGVLETGMLANTCSAATAMEIQQSARFNALDSTLQTFIVQVGNGHQTLEQLMSDQSRAIKSCVEAAGESTRQHIDQRMSEIDRIQSTREQHEQLLNSLRWPGMNERVNQLRDASVKTFEWAFGVSERDEQLLSRKDHPKAIRDDGSIDWDAVYLTIALLNQHKLFPWDNLASWLSTGGSRNMYWVNGKPGSGKSTFMRFLVHHPKTKRNLALWAYEGKARILSHFFWKPGQNQQKNVQGMLQCLLYQMLEDDIVLTRKLFSTAPEAARKRDFYDWSARELEDVFDQCLSLSENYFCIFLDGVDEIGDTHEIDSLFEILGKLHLRPKLKLCVSSRPESNIKPRFEACPSLRLQDLTLRDVIHLASSELEPYASSTISGSPSPPISVVGLVEIIALKAQGIMLWVHLVLVSVKRGLMNGDPISLLIRRTESMPNNISNLYQDMWERLREDRVYGPIGAKLLNIVLLHKELYKMLFPLPLVHYFSLAHLTVILDDRLQQVMVENSGHVCLVELETGCEKTRRNIDLGCAGLLEIARERRPWLTRVEFTHRTAYDFLLNSEEGQKIRQLDPDWTHLKPCIMKIMTGLLAVPKLVRFDNMLDALKFLEEHGHLTTQQTDTAVLVAENIFKGMSGQCSRVYGCDFLGLATTAGLHRFVAKRLSQWRTSPGWEITIRYRQWLLSQCFRHAIHPDILKSILSLGFEANGLAVPWPYTFPIPIICLLEKLFNGLWRPNQKWCDKFRDYITQAVISCAVHGAQKMMIYFSPCKAYPFIQVGTSTLDLRLYFGPKSNFGPKSSLGLSLNAVAAIELGFELSQQQDSGPGYERVGHYFVSQDCRPEVEMIWLETEGNRAERVVEIIGRGPFWGKILPRFSRWAAELRRRLNEIGRPNMDWSLDLRDFFPIEEWPSFTSEQETPGGEPLGRPGEELVGTPPVYSLQQIPDPFTEGPLDLNPRVRDVWIRRGLLPGREEEE